MKTSYALLACVLISGTAAADNLAFGLKPGTLGMGAELTKRFSPTLAGRLGINAFSHTESATRSDINYDYNVKLRSVGAMADWHPSQGSFRTTAGLLYNGNKVDLSAQPASNVNIGGTTYTPAQVGSLDGKIEVKKLSPYVGFGWGTTPAKDKAWGFTADVGALYQGKPRASLRATCGRGLNAALCSQLQSDTAEEQQQLQEDVDSFRWYPVLAVGASYRF